MTESAALARIKTQLPLSDKASRADYVIDNSGELLETERQVRELVSKLMPGWGRWFIEWAGLPVIGAVLGGMLVWWRGVGWGGSA